MKQKILAILFSLFLLACEEDTNPETENFVIEGFLFSNETVADIKIKTITPFQDTVSSQAINDATVTLFKQEQSYGLEFSVKTGKYFYEGNNLEVNPGEEFILEVVRGDRVATATTIVPPPPNGVVLVSDSIIEIPEIKIFFGLEELLARLFEDARVRVSWDNPEGYFHFAVVENRVDTLDPILPPEIPDDATEFLKSFRFISEPTQDTFYDIPVISLDTHGLHVVKIYRVNQEYVDLFENAVQDSRDLNEPPSNVINALGIFTAFASDSVFFEVVRK